MRTLIALGSLLFILWFIPWVFVFSLGVVVYFPYEADGKSRFTRMTGPLPHSVGLDGDWTSSTEIPLSCRAALIAAEDGKFLEHNGVDAESMEKALERNAKKGRIKRGGSTITQQLIKNVFLYRDKSYVRKAREVVGALLLDLMMEKRTQMTWYFNVVEFGPRVYGIKAASRYYYRKDPKALNLSECASLVALLRDPVKSSRGLKAPARPPYLEQRIQRIINAISQSGVSRRLRQQDA